MSIRIELADGAGALGTGFGLAALQTLTSSASPLRTITFTTPNTITLAGTGFTWNTGIAANDVIRIRGSAANDGLYTIETRTSGTVVTVFEDSITTSANVAGTTAVTYRRDAAPANSEYTGPLTIEAFYLSSLRVNFLAGTNLKKYPVQPNDRLIIKNSGGGAGAAAQVGNDGSWRVDRVLGPTLVRIDTAARGTTTLAKRSGLSKGTGDFKLGSWNAVLTDERAPNFAAIKYRATAPGSATGHTFITDHFYASRDLSVFPHIGIQGIEFLHTDANATAFTSKSEITLNKQVLPYPMITPPQVVYPGDIRAMAVWSTGATDTVTIGTLGSDSDSTKGGSFLVGWHMQNADIFGSVWVGAAGQANFGNGTRIYNSIDYRSTITSTGTSDFKNLISIPGVFPVLATLPGGTYSNVILSGTPNFAAVFNLLTQDITLSNLTIAQSVFDSLPAGVLSGSGAFTLIILDPTADYDIDALGSTGFLSKQYTYNPTFVSRNDTGTSPIPIPNLSVRIWEIDGASVETLVFDDVTDLNGQLNVGVGVQLQRQSFNSGLIVTYTHRIRVEGTNYSAVNQIFAIRQKSVFDFPIASQATDFEGEFNH